jgi:hypothetical protein
MLPLRCRALRVPWIPMAPTTRVRRTRTSMSTPAVAAQGIFLAIARASVRNRATAGVIKLVIGWQVSCIVSKRGRQFTPTRTFEFQTRHPGENICLLSGRIRNMCQREDLLYVYGFACTVQQENKEAKQSGIYTWLC